MGKLADAIRGVALPTQKQTQLLRLDRQYVELETQMDSFQEQNDALEAENKKLQAANKKLKEDVAGLEAQLKARTPSKEKSAVQIELEEFEEHLISYLAQVRPKTQRTTEAVGAAMRKFGIEMTDLKAGVYLRRLSDRGLCGLALNLGSGPSYWFLHPLGEDVAVIHKLDG